VSRILVLTTSYPPHHFGGYELVCRDVVSRWNAEGHEVTVLTSNLNVPGSCASESRRDVRRDLHVTLSEGKLSYPSVANRRRFELANQSALGQALETINPEVVSVWHMLGMSSALLTTLTRSGIPMVCVVGDEWPRYLIETDQWMRLWKHWPRLWPTVERVSGVPTCVPELGRAASFCFASQYLRRRCEESSPWTFPRSTVIYHGIDTESFPINRRAPVPWSWRLMTAGRLDPRKGFASAISALQYLPEEAHLGVFSSVDDAYRLQLEQVALELGVSHRVTFGVRDRLGLRREYLEADAFIFPSEWPEPFGLVPIEAMACGTPVLASGTGGSGEFLVEGRSCLRFEPGDPQSLAASIGRLAESPELRGQLRKTGWALAEELTVDRLAQALGHWHVAAANRLAGEPAAARQLRPLDLT
jgi:glycogen synthase